MEQGSQKTVETKHKK